MVVGIIGNDVLVRAIIELPPRLNLSPLLIPLQKGNDVDNKGNESEREVKPNYTLNLYDVDAYELDNPNFKWQELFVVANLPHANATFSYNNDCEKTGLFMLDTGAGGVGLMFLQRAMRELELDKELEKTGRPSTTVKAVGGSGALQLQVPSGRVNWMELSGHRHKQVPCLFINSTKFDVTVYGAGIICMGLLERCTTILDYMGRRVAFVPAHRN